MSSRSADRPASPAASMLRPGRPVISQATNAGGLITTAPATVARVSVLVGPPLTFTITFQGPCIAAATSARPIAIAINAAQRLSDGAGRAHRGVRREVHRLRGQLCEVAPAAGPKADRPRGC